MKEFGIRHLALMMVMLTSVVYTASPNRKMQLNQIREQANNTELKQMNLRVKVTPRKHLKCPPNFFCWAEQSLIQATNDISKRDKLKSLTDALDIYNKEFGHVNCTLETEESFDLADLLEDIKECVDVAVMDKHNATTPRSM